MQTYIFVLVAVALSDYNHIQTIRYYSTISECQVAMQKLEPTINKDFIRLDCLPRKVFDGSDSTTRAR